MSALKGTARPLALVMLILLLTAGPWPASGPGWAAPAAETPKRGGRLVFAVGSDPYNPAPFIFAGGAGFVTNGNIYNSLLRPDEQGRLRPDLAETVTLLDPTTYVVRIKEGVKFHEGQTLTAEDVKFSFEFMMRRGSGATRGGLLAALIDRVEVLDPTTVRFVLKAPAATLPSVLALRDVAIFSKTWVDAGGDYRRNYNGTGPFKMTSFVRGEKYVMRRNDSYFKQGLPYLDEIEVRVISDEFVRADGVASGDLDVVDFFPWQRAAAFERNPRLKVEKGWSVFNALVFNPNKAPWNDKRVRQAVAYAIDRENTNKVGHGGLGRTITGGLMQKGSRFFCSDLENFYTFNPGKAKELLAQAGHPRGTTMNLLLANFAPYLDSWAVVGENLKAVGINANVISTDTGGMAEARVNGKYDVLWTGTLLLYDDPDSLSTFYESSGPFYGRTHNFKDDKVDEMFARGRALRIHAHRQKLYCDLMRYALDQAWWAYITWRPNMFGMKAAVNGFVSLPGPIQTQTPILLEKTWLNR